MKEINEIEFMLFKKHLLDVCGIDVPPEKQYLFSTRLSGLLTELGFNNFSQLYRHIRDNDNAETRRQLVEAMTTHETSFFRDVHPFEALRVQLLPTLAALRKSQTTLLSPRLRFLSVGVATGEEAYSLAITVREWLAAQEDYAPSDIDIIGLDISHKVLGTARSGWYQKERIRSKVPLHIIEKFFEDANDGYRVKAEIRSMVSFAACNLIDPIEHLGFFDAIFCRNVIIYFSFDLKRRVIQQLHDMLKPQGVLLLGASETLYQLSDGFESRLYGPTTFHVRKDTNDGRDPWS